MTRTPPAAVAKPGTSRWRVASDRVLSELFAIGNPPPTRVQLTKAYPFGERKRWPYKVWLRRVRAWKIAHAQGRAPSAVVRPAPRRRLDRDTLPLFSDL